MKAIEKQLHAGSLIVQRDPLGKLVRIFWIYEVKNNVCYCRDIMFNPGKLQSHFMTQGAYEKGILASYLRNDCIDYEIFGG